MAKKKKIFLITIEEMVSETFEVKASSLEEALEIAEEQYESGELVLEPGNLVCKQISGEDPETSECVDWYEF